VVEHVVDMPPDVVRVVPAMTTIAAGAVTECRDLVVDRDG